MSDLAATLWTAFGSESAEHLGAIEPLLVGLAGPGRSASVARAEVGELFRAFHSLKGLARAMSRHGMEGVAHQAESLLGLVRDHGAPVGEEMVDALLESLDGLRQLREAAMARADDGPPPPALIARLQRAITAAGGTVEEPAVVETAHAAETAAAQAAGVETAGASSGLGEDAEMLALFAETMQMQLPELAAILTAGESGRQDLADTVEALAHGAGVMEMDALADVLLELGAELQGRSLPLDAAGVEAVLPQLLDLAEKAGLLAEMLEADTGAGLLSAALSGGTVGRWPAGLPAALDALAAAVRTGGPAVAGSVPGVLGLLAQARAVAPEGARLLALLGDVCPRLAAGGLVAGEALGHALASIAEAGDDALNEDYAAILSAGLLATLGATEAAAEGGGLRLSGPLIGTLDTRQQQEVAAALASGRRAYALMLFLEDAPVVASGLLGWLPGVGSMPTNRSVFVQGESWFEVLLVSELAPDALQAGLLQHDPDRACLRELRELRDAGEVPIALGPGGPDPAVATAAAPPSGAAGAGAGTRGELRISGAVIDRFMDTISEVRAGLAGLDELLKSARARDELAQLAQLGQTLPETRAAVDLLRARQVDAARQVERMAGQLRVLHAAALEVRIVPIDLALSRLPRVVRALAREQGKEVDLVLEGREVRVDKAIVDRLIEPLMHMVRNAIDHGIERPDAREAAGKPRRARLRIRAVQGVGEVDVIVGDDGRGLDRERILLRGVERGLVLPEEAASMPADAVHRLVFAPGFSTAATLTETSGRGVGMDVVLTEVHRLGGEIGIESQPGEGTSFSLRLPLTAAMQTAVLVEAGGQLLAVPERAISTVAELPREALTLLDGRPAFSVGGQEVPVLSLGSLLWPDDAPRDAAGVASLVVVTHEGESVAFEVDRVIRRQELLLLRLHPLLAACRCVGGAAVLGDGEVVLSLDAEALIGTARAASWQLQRSASA